MAETPDRERLRKLGEQIDAVRQDRAPKPKAMNKALSADMAWRMVIELVTGMGMGFAAGYGLDTLLGTLPIFLVVFSLLGFAAGVRLVIATAKEAQAQIGGTPDDNTDPAQDGSKDRNGS